MSNMSADDMFMSLTGFDELAIKKAFGSDVFTLREEPGMFLRALVFVWARREGKTDVEAKNAAMEMAFSDVQGTFPKNEDEEPMPEEPVTDAGKGDSLSA